MPIDLKQENKQIAGSLGFYSLGKLRKESKHWHLLKIRIHRLTHWEYWPSWTLYVPMSLYFVRLILKTKSFGFFNAVNPGIENGGMTLKNKHKVDKLFPKKYFFGSLLLKDNEDVLLIEEKLEKAKLSFPLIAKPDDGCRGKGVCVVHHVKELQHYLRTASFPVLVQEFIDLPNEIGIFYCKLPSAPNGFISGIVKKEYVNILGNGKDSVEQLLYHSFRYYPLRDEIMSQNPGLVGYVPSENESLTLTKIGNHARGATFYDISHLSTSKLKETLESVCQQIPGLNYGRFDLKYNTWEELENGENFKIIEFNGAAAEPTHIYDPKRSYISALAEIKKHWKIMGEIAIQNHKLGHPYLSTKKSFQILFDFWKGK